MEMSICVSHNWQLLQYTSVVIRRYSHYSYGSCNMFIYDIVFDQVMWFPAPSSRSRLLNWRSCGSRQFREMSTSSSPYPSKIPTHRMYVVIALNVPIKLNIIAKFTRLMHIVVEIRCYQCRLVFFRPPQIPLKSLGRAIDVPVWVERQTVDLKICMFDRLFQDTILVNNR